MMMLQLKPSFLVNRFVQAPDPLPRQSLPSLNSLLSFHMPSHPCCPRGVMCRSVNTPQIQLTSTLQKQPCLFASSFLSKVSKPLNHPLIWVFLVVTFRIVKLSKRAKKKRHYWWDLKFIATLSSCKHTHTHSLKLGL